MNRHEAAVVSAFTGVMLGEFSDMHEYIESIMKTPVFTHQLGDADFVKKVKEAAKPDFEKIHFSLKD